ncbi:MAG TPA: hypothetical protein VLV28_01890 [Gaiellaceae bacterium]|nr:hypothetical protein [Gaiellaceae bacterium]
MSTGANALEPAGSKPSRYLKEHRLKLTIWIGAIEGALTLIGVIPHLVVFVLAAAAILFWVFAGRNYKSSTARHLTWIFAASQAIAVLIPTVLHVAEWLAIGVVVVAAVVGLVILFAEREKL